MEYTKLNGDELTNYVRAAITNNEYLNTWAEAIAASKRSDFELGRKLGVLHYELARRVTNIFPWLTFEPWEFDDSVRIVIREYENEQQ